MHWYEWLAGLLVLAIAFGVRAGPVYKCVGASGATAFQDRPCAAVRDLSEVEIAPHPVCTPSPKHAVESRPRSGLGRTARSEYVRSRSNECGTAYECRASDGRVFPRHLLALFGSRRRHGARARQDVGQRVR